MRKKIGIIQGRLTKTKHFQQFPKKWEEEFDKAKKIGFKSIEWVLDTKKNPLLKKNIKDKIFYLKKKNKIEIKSICCDIFMNHPLVQKNKINKKNFKLLKFLVNKLCSNYKIKILDVPFLKKNKIREVNFKKYIKLLKIIEKDLINKKVFLAIETDLPPIKISKLLKKFKSKYICINYDMGNSAYWGYDPNLEFKLYGKRIANVHIKDCSKELYSVKFGQGSVDFENISKLLEKNKYKKDFIIQGYRGKNNYAIAKEQLNFSKKFF